MKKRSAKFWLCIALVLCLISMIGTSCMESGWGKVHVTEYNTNLREVSAEIAANNAITGKDIQITFQTGGPGGLFGAPVGDDFHFRLFVPDSASESNPAPAIVCCHGGSNVLEMQMPFYIELARRGYVVISMDAAGNGETDNGVNSLTAETQGMLAAVEFIMSLPYVDESNVGITGHSYGNLACINTIKAMNTSESGQRIRSYVNGDGIAFLSFFTEDLADGLIMTVGAGMYGEAKTSDLYILESDMAKSLVSFFDKNFDGSSITDGQYYSNEGEIAAPALGQALNVEEAIRITEYHGTHPMWHFSKEGAAIALEGFYAGLGTPNGVEEIPVDNQIWPIEAAFQLLGLLGFFMMLFPLVSILSDTKYFSAIKCSVPEKAQLPSIKDPRRIFIFLLTMAACIIFAFKSYVVLYPAVKAYMDMSVYPGNDVFTNPIGFWTMACGMFTLVVIGVNWALTRVICRDKLYNPFSTCSFNSVSQFFKTVLFSASVVAIMYAVVAVAGLVFHADFRVCTLAVQVGESSWMYIILTRYLPMWLLFYVPYAILNASSRFKETPEWLEVLVLSITNCIALVIYAAIQYSSLVANHGLKVYDAFGGIACFVVAPVLAFAAVSSRFIYKKTGNAMAAGLINGTIFCLMTVYGNGWTADLMFF